MQAQNVQSEGVVDVETDVPIQDDLYDEITVLASGSSGHGNPCLNAASCDGLLIF